MNNSVNPSVQSLFVLLEHVTSLFIGNVLTSAIPPPAEDAAYNETLKQYFCWKKQFIVLS